jgi:hypothetical protein
MADRSYAKVSDEEIAAAIGEELPDRKAMTADTSDGGPDEFGLAADSAADTTPPGHDPESQPFHPQERALSEEEN